jgi:hypothetical protein
VTRTGNDNGAGIAWERRSARINIEDADNMPSARYNIKMRVSEIPFVIIPQYGETFDTTAPSRLSLRDAQRFLYVKVFSRAIGARL